jgi:predicted nucleic acid-binding protein
VASVAAERFLRALAGADRVGVDTPALIYHLEGIAPYADLTAELFARAAAGRVSLIVSTIVAGELLVGPWRTGGRREARRMESVLRGFPAAFADVTWEVVRQAAEVRGRTGLPFPEAIVVACCLQHGAHTIVTNDAAWRVKPLPCRIILLDDYA